jgi:hypothetical protein
LVRLSGVAASSQTFANGINGAGQIVGTFAVGVVPEPSGLVLLLTGAVGLLGYGAWRRARPRAWRRGFAGSRGFAWSSFVFCFRSTRSAWDFVTHKG